MKDGEISDIEREGERGGGVGESGRGWEIEKEREWEKDNSPFLYVRRISHCCYEENQMVNSFCTSV